MTMIRFWTSKFNKKFRSLLFEATLCLIEYDNRGISDTEIVQPDIMAIRIECRIKRDQKGYRGTSAG